MENQMPNLPRTLLRILLPRTEIQDGAPIAIEAIQEQLARFGFWFDFVGGD